MRAVARALVARTKIDSKDACRRIYMWAFASRRLFACLVDVRVLTRLEAKACCSQPGP